MESSILVKKLNSMQSNTDFSHILDLSKADSGGSRDINFLKLLVDNKLLTYKETVLKRSTTGISESFYKENYVKMNFESNRHFLCRSVIQEELKRLDIDTISGIDVGNMEVLRTNSNYDIITNDFSALIDVGLTPARNYFRGLTDLKVKNYLITSYFDDYIDDIIFFNFSRTDDDLFINAVKDYEEGFKLYSPESAVVNKEIQLES